MNMEEKRKMELPCFKYDGAGNDFILFDETSSRGTEQLQALNDLNWRAKICDRNHGIGADGVLVLKKGCMCHGKDGNNDVPCQFTMQYYNADGGEAVSHYIVSSRIACKYF